MQEPGQGRPGEGVLEKVIREGQEAAKFAYTTGLLHGAKRMEVEHRQREAEQAAVTASVRQYILKLEAENQSLVSELAELKSGDITDGIRTVIRVAWRPVDYEEVLSQVTRSASVADFAELRAELDRSPGEGDESPPDGIGEHFDGVDIQ